MQVCKLPADEPTASLRLWTSVKQSRKPSFQQRGITEWASSQQRWAYAEFHGCDLERCLPVNKYLLDGIIVERPDAVQHLCADKGYAGEPAQQTIKNRLYIPHVKQRGEEIQEKKINPTYKARRYVVEVAHSWCNRFRKLLVRYEKLAERYEALLHMAAAIIAFRKAGFIYE